MTNNPENYMVQMTAKGIEDMIGKAIAPFVEDNRKLRLAFGYATAIASEGLEMPHEKIQTDLLAVASRTLTRMPKSIPVDLLMTAGVAQWNSRRDLLKRDEEPTGDRDEPVGLDRLKNILEITGHHLEEWFESAYGVDFVSKHEGNSNLFYEKGAINSNDAFLPLAWKIRDDIAWYRYHSWDLRQIKEADAELEE